ASMCGSASPSTSPGRSGRASSRRRCCARWCAKENSARRADAGSTSGMIDEPYGAFAYAYDKALGERYFRAIRRLVDDALERFPAPGKTHLDVACGTGLAMRHFARRGFVTTGIDLSPPMLQMARGRARRLVAADVRALPFANSFGVVTCLYDALNHMLDRAELVAAFREIARVMDDGARFVFDMNHPEIYPVVWGMK